MQPVLIFNLAQAHRLAGHIEQALTLYARAKQHHNTPSADSPTGGALVVTAQRRSGAAIHDGTVMIDEEPEGKLARGTLTVTGVAKGRHTVAIEAGGYRRFEETVTVRDGERTSLAALLRETETPGSSPRSTMLWKVSTGASAVIAVTGFAYAYHSYDRMLQHSGAFDPVIDPNTGRQYTTNIVAPDAGDCGRTPEEIASAKHSQVASQSNFDRACTWKTRISIGLAVSGVGVVGAVVSLIMLTRDPGPPETTATGAHGKKPEAAVVPIVTPDGGGASFSFTW